MRSRGMIMQPVYSYKILQKYAGRLYGQALTTSVIYSAIAGFLGWGSGCHLPLR